jgi:hypothetical protein
MVPVSPPTTVAVWKQSNKDAATAAMTVVEMESGISEMNPCVI